MLILNVIVLFFVPSGNQLWMTLLENCFVAVLMTGITLYENHLMSKNQDDDSIRRKKKKDEMRFLSAFDDYPEIEQRISYTRIKGKTVFADLTVDELLTEFGGRNCKSMGDY